jgi:protoporphyrinogen oxidase
MKKLAIIGAGPAGLTAAYEIQKRSDAWQPVLFEAGHIVGGISRTESHNGYRFDIGGHRFFTKVEEVETMWKEVLEDDFITVPRLSRIYYKGKFYDYPLKMMNALRNIGPYETFRIIISFLKWQARPHPTEETFEQWVINRFGGRLYMHFFRSYTEKVWGINPKNIRADWAAQRIKNLSLTKAVWNALTGSNDTASLIEEFQYPRLGPGMMWERCAELVESKGGEVSMNSRVVQVNRDGNRVLSIDVESWDPNAEDPAATKTKQRVEADAFVNSMAVRDLIDCMDPPPPPEVIEASKKLKYRDFLIVTLVLNVKDPFPDNWIYIHSDDIRCGRIQNFRAWSQEMLPDQSTSSIGMEYFCQIDDDLWTKTNEELTALAGEELENLGLAKASAVVDSSVIRQPKAYPVYDGEYQDALAVVRNWMEGLENFQTVGRNGLHRYNNQDHSMLSAMLAARNILGETHDVWGVNVERSYHEELEVRKKEGAVNLAPSKV